MCYAAQYLDNYLDWIQITHIPRAQCKQIDAVQDIVSLLNNIVELKETIYIGQQQSARDFVRVVFCHRTTNLPPHPSGVEFQKFLSQCPYIPMESTLLSYIQGLWFSQTVRFCQLARVYTYYIIIHILSRHLPRQELLVQIPNLCNY